MAISHRLRNIRRLGNNVVSVTRHKIPLSVLEQPAREDTAAISCDQDVAVVAFAMSMFRDRWPPCALTAAAILWLSGLSPAEDEDPPLRMIIATNAVCRAEPSRAAAKVRPYQVGDLLSGDKKEIPKDGEAWYLDRWRMTSRSPDCWVYGPLTTEFVRTTPEPALLAVVDHILHRSDTPTFQEYVEVENLLLTDSYSSVVRSSGLLQSGRLRIVERVVREATGRSIERDPLKKAWVLAHRDLLDYFDPDDAWYVRPDAYWSLYERHKQAPWAEDLAWAAAQLPIPSDECYANCVLDKVNRTFVQYWRRYPTGTYITPALAQATPLVNYATRLACSDRQSKESVDRDLLNTIRNSLAHVISPEKRELLASLDEIQRKCARS